MRFEVETLDDALLELYPELLRREPVIKASRGSFSEILGVSIEIQEPRARLSRSQTRGKVFSSLGELLWYLTGDNRLDFIEPYIPRYRDDSEDHITVHGGYGPRLFRQRCQDQIRNVIALLHTRPTSRRAVIQILNAEDVAEKHIEIPCTTTLQFTVRDDVVQLIATMRSNDAYLGLPHDVFCFTMLQEIVARSLGREVGHYIHFVGSMHLYEYDRHDAESLVGEGYQSRIKMPPMPAGDPWLAIAALLQSEARAATGDLFEADEAGLDPYWSDLIRMVQVYFCQEDERIKALRDAISFKRYGPYITSRLGKRATLRRTRPE